MTDLELVRETRSQNDQAFEEIVKRYSNLVYLSALRRVEQDHALAQDITQSVFIILHKKRERLRDEVPLAGWLLKTTYFVARRALTAKFRRHRMEAAALEQATAQAGGDDLGFLPFLDDALLSLKAAEQRCVSHRFFSGASLREIADLEKISEDAAQKRVSRSLEKLRSYLARRGVRVAATAAIATCLTESAKAASPALVSGILNSVSTAATTTAQTASAALLAKSALAALARQQLVLTGIAMLSGAAVLSPIVWHFVGPTPARVPPPRLRPPMPPPTAASLASDWSSLMRSAAALIRSGPPAPNTPQASAYNREVTAMYAQTTRVEAELDKLLAATNNPKPIITEFMTRELVANLQLNAQQSDTVSNLIASAISNAQDSKACFVALSQERTNLIPQIRAVLTPDQSGYFDSYYRSDGITLFLMATLQTNPKNDQAQ